MHATHSFAPHCVSNCSYNRDNSAVEYINCLEYFTCSNILLLFSFPFITESSYNTVIFYNALFYSPSDGMRAVFIFITFISLSVNQLFSN